MGFSRNKQKILFLLGGFLLGTVLFFVLVVLPMQEKIRLTSQQLVEAKTETQQTYESWLNLEKSRRFIDQAEQDISKVEEVLLTKENTLGLVEIIEEIARKTNVGHSLTIISEDEKEGVISFRLRIEGDFSSALNFIYLLENIKYPIKLQALTTSRQASKTKVSAEQQDLSGELDTTVNFSAFLKQ